VRFPRATRHMSEAFDFLGFRVQWRRKQGTSKWYLCTFIATRPGRAVKAKIRALTHRTSQKDLGYVLTSINMVLHGWAGYFKHAIAQRVSGMLDNFTWRKVIRMLCARHRWKWKDVRRRYTTPNRAVAAGHGGRDRAEADRRDPDRPVSLPRQQDPQPLGHTTHLTADTVESPLRRKAHGGFGERPGETDREQSRHRAPGLLSAGGFESLQARRGHGSLSTPGRGLFVLAGRNEAHPSNPHSGALVAKCSP
jgi:group II intron maturase